jgi:hypothetical protein
MVDDTALVLVPHFDAAGSAVASGIVTLQEVSQMSFPVPPPARPLGLARGCLQVNAYISTWCHEVIHTSARRSFP